MVFAAWVRCVPEQAGRVGGVDTRTGVVCVWREDALARREWRV